MAGANFGKVALWQKTNILKAQTLLLQKRNIGCFVPAVKMLHHGSATQYRLKSQHVVYSVYVSEKDTFFRMDFCKAYESKKYIYDFLHSTSF